MMIDLTDKIAIVTGGASGIGRGICLMLAGQGANIVVADMNVQGAEATATEVAATGRQSVAVAVDVTDRDSVSDMVAQVMERFGKIDILINDAGVAGAANWWERETPNDDDWDHVLAVNLRGVFLCCRAVVPHMKDQQSGKIVNISSGTVFMGTTNLLHYVTSKAGVIGLTRGLARELGEYNINVNAIAPGLTESMEEMQEVRSGLYEQRIQARSIKRGEVPEDLVGAAVFLCSTDSDFMTGQTMVVDGGAQMH